MTKQEWLAKVTEHKSKLLSLVETYHPAARQARRDGLKQKMTASLPITAPGAEFACERVRESIAARERNREAPGERFRKAIGEGDWQEINSLLNSAWFGVPESTACWQIPGFKEAVDLIEDLPEEADIHEGQPPYDEDQDEADDAAAF